MTSIPWVIISATDGKIICTRCRTSRGIPVGLDVDSFITWARVFADDHLHKEEKDA